MGIIYGSNNTQMIKSGDRGRENAFCFRSNFESELQIGRRIPPANALLSTLVQSKSPSQR